MARYIDADALYEQTAEWEASALAYIAELNRTPLAEMDEDEKAEWRRWTAILGERSAFKHDVADAPTADVVEVVRCKDCVHWKTELESTGIECEPGENAHICWIDGMITRTNDYCSYGRRK